jgi:hypothetical protein
VQYDEHLYSAPHQLVGEKLELHATDNLITLYFQNKRIASHPRVHRRGVSTMPEHMPIRHEKHHKWNRGRLMNWAKDIGSDTLTWVVRLLDSKAHEQQSYRVCLGLLNLTRQYPPERINQACAIANQQQLDRLKNIKSILSSNLDTLVQEDDSLPALPQQHENIRGPNSFH